LVELIDYQIHNFSTFSNKTMNVGGGINTSFSLLELTTLCENITGNRLNIQKITENRAADLRIYIGDNSKINQLCGWKPSRTVNQLVEDSYHWLTENEKQLKSILA
jgi:CDP-paratose 2-epimerase